MELFFLAVLFLVMMYALGSGYPVAFALPGAAILTISLAGICGYLFASDSGEYFTQDGPIEWLPAGVTNFRGIYWEVERDTLIAIPLFIFMGIMLQRSRIAEDLLVTMAQLFGPIPGGLGISVVFVGALLAATTGIVGATVVAMGLISLPAMLRNNYSKPLATGTICASGTLGQIIPPSIVLIILADQLASAADQAASERKSLYKEATGEFSMPSTLDIVSTSAGDMFLGAFIPGLVLVGLYMAYILISALLRPSTAPAVHYDGKLMERAFIMKVLMALVPPLVLIFVVLGSIIAGIATVNQAGAIGAVGATIMAGYRLREGHKDAYYPAMLSIGSLLVIMVLMNIFSLNVRKIESGFDMLGIALAAVAVVGFVASVAWSGWRTFKIEDTLNGVMVESAKTTSMVFIILLGAAMLTSAFRGFGGEEIVKHFLTGLPGGFWAQFIVVMLVIFLLGFFLDFIEIAVVVVPIVSPILLADPSSNVTAVWLGVMIGLNIQTSFLTPPFGFALFYLRGVASSVVKTIDIYKGVVPFIALQLLGLTIVGFYPPLVNYLPVRTYLTSETAPPPKNPRLQACLEDHLFTQYLEEKDGLMSANATLASLDLSAVSPVIKRNINTTTKGVNGIFDQIATIRAAEDDVAAAAVDYRPVHRVVRTIERDIRRNDRKLEQMKKDLRGLDDPDAQDALRAEMDALEVQNEELRAEIPAEWESANKDYKTITATLKKAQRSYRKTVDDAYSGLIDSIMVLEAADDLAAILPDLRALEGVITMDGPHDVARDEIKEVSSMLNAVPGTNAISSALSKAKKALRKRKEKPKKALKEIKKAISLMEADVASRQQAQATVLPALKTYEEAVRNTIGLRQQSRLTTDLATSISGCLARHRDISLHF
ncbi:MAG: TRAP transporter large permease subunit [Alphaproteobacteria bacterium]|nr:TRAP transporter large permease subunit [Alphaproteobacteria bacterium]